MKRVAGKVTRIYDFFGRKSKTSKGKALGKLKKQVQKTNRYDAHTLYYILYCVILITFFIMAIWSQRRVRR
jgi:hypothetical protein